MSLVVGTTKGTITCYIQILGDMTVTIGEHEIPLEDFCGLAAHFLGGGLFGWGGKIPPNVLVTLCRICLESIKKKNLGSGFGEVQRNCEEKRNYEEKRG